MEENKNQSQFSSNKNQKKRDAPTGQGSVPVVTAPQTSSEAPPPEEVKNEVATMNHILNVTLQDLQFIGFSPAAERQKLASLGPRDVGTLVAAYVQIGNNPQNASQVKRVRKRDDVVLLAEKAKTTLARVAIAFAPLTLELRKRAVESKIIQNQFNIEADLLPLCDPALSGYAGSKIKDFLLKFDVVLAKADGRSKSDHGPDAVERWLTIAISGYKADVGIHDVMNKPSDDVIKWFLSCFPK
jgi:hypothetical protein